MNQGDFRSPAYVIQTEDGRRVTRFYYKNYRIIRGKPILPGLPSVYTEDDEEALTLCVELEDKTMNAGIALYYTIFRDYDAVCRHVEVINRVFSPTRKEIDYAYEVMDAIRLAKEQGRGAIALRGKMIDAPIVARAEQTIAAAREMGLGREERS